MAELGSFEYVLDQYAPLEPVAKSAAKSSPPSGPAGRGEVIVAAGHRRNFRPDNCGHCNAFVESGQGHLQQETTGWRVYCSLYHARGQDGPPKPPTGRVLTAAGEIYTPTREYANEVHFRSFPRAVWGRGQFGIDCWKVSLKNEDRHRVLDLAARLRLEVDPELLRREPSRQGQLAARSGAYPFQVEGVNWLVDREKVAMLGDDMGLGKTLQVIMSINPTSDSVLVICPSSVKYNWKAEIKKFRPDLRKVYVCEGRHMFGLPLQGEIVIASYDLLPDWLLPTKEEGADGKAVTVYYLPSHAANRIPHVTLVVDEAQMLSNRSQRTTKIDTLSHRCKKVIALTGTPLRNRADQMLRMLQALNMLLPTFGTVQNFRRLFNAYRVAVGDQNVWQFGSPEPEVPSLLRRVMLRRTREQVLTQLPPRTYQTMEVTYPPGVGREMDEIWQRYQDEYGTSPSEFPPFEWISRVRAALAESRIEFVLDYVERCEENKTPLIVASAHRGPIDVLADRPGWAVITGSTSPAERQRLVELFQAGKLDGIGLTIGAAATGINLTKSWLMLEVDLDWTPANNHQLEARILRIGQTAEKVQYVQMVSSHPLEQHLHGLLRAKQALIEAAVENEAPVVLPA